MKVKLLYREKSICDLECKDKLSGWVSWLMSKNPSNTSNINLLLEQNAYTMMGASLPSSGHSMHYQSQDNFEELKGGKETVLWPKKRNQ